MPQPPPGNAQLPPEIMVDRLLVRVDRLLAENDPGAAFEAMNEILNLQEEHDLQLRNDVHFRYARVAFAAGQTATAIASLNEYLVAAGRDGEFCQQALELLDAADVRLQEEERAARSPVNYVFRDCSVCPTMVVMPERRLALGRYEVTVGEYRAFAEATAGGAGGGCDASLFVTPDSWRDPGHPQTDRHPVTCLSWDDAQEYASWLSRKTGAEYRLPRETEWGTGGRRVSARLLLRPNGHARHVSRRLLRVQPGRAVGHGVECRGVGVGLLAGRLPTPCGPRPRLGLQ